MREGGKKVGIITFHASYNCGSMLQAYALQTFLKKIGYIPEILNFSSEGQRKLYSLFFNNTSLKNLIKNIVIFFHRRRIANNNARYEAFKERYFALSGQSVSDMSELSDDYWAVIAGADQIWNVTIADYDDAYFLPWVRHSKKIAYAPSFGARNIAVYAANPEKAKEYLNRFDALSIRENNGKRWIKEFIGKDIPIVLDPTLLLSEKDYEPITSTEQALPERYIFYYAPNYSGEINGIVSKISRKYGLPVIAFNAKSYYLKGMAFSGFNLPDGEDPGVYLQLMKNAELVITTSFHGTIFASVFRRNFWTIKNGGMYGDDDRVLTLVNQLALQSRLIPPRFDDKQNYMQKVDYSRYSESLEKLRRMSVAFLKSALEENNENTE